MLSFYLLNRNLMPFSTVDESWQAWHQIMSEYLMSVKKQHFLKAGTIQTTAVTKISHLPMNSQNTIPGYIIHFRQYRDRYLWGNNQETENEEGL